MNDKMKKNPHRDEQFVKFENEFMDKDVKHERIYAYKRRHSYNLEPDMTGN